VCLAQVCRTYGDHRPLDRFLEAVHRNPDGGTLAVYIGQAAQELGYRARLYPLGVRVFDPTWWDLRREALAVKLSERLSKLHDPAARAEAQAWVSFLEAGGSVSFEELTPELLVRMLDKGRPIVCGLSAQWLYRSSRELDDGTQDDVAGRPVGHFVVVSGHTGGRHFHVVDPFAHAPPGGTGTYPLPAARLVNAILLGDATSDAVLLEVWPATRASPA
jgi:hypothetical protein